MRRAGFSGDRLLNAVEVAGAKINLKNGGSGLPLKEERQELQRWLLGMLCLTPGPLAVKSAIVPSDPAAVRITSNDGLSAVLQFEASSFVPLRLRYAGSVPAVDAGLARTDPRGAAPGSSPRTAELTLSFEQRRRLDGFSLPYHVRRLAGDVVLEDIRISSIELNPGLNVSDFEPR